MQAKAEVHQEEERKEVNVNRGGRGPFRGRPKFDQQRLDYD
ncbi:MAG: hypothetical protein ACK521_08410 [bacterium]